MVINIFILNWEKKPFNSIHFENKTEEVKEICRKSGWDKLCVSELSQENEFVGVRVGELAGKTRDGAASVQVHVCECVWERGWISVVELKLESGARGELTFVWAFVGSTRRSKFRQASFCLALME